MSSLQEAEYATYTTRGFLEVLLHTYVTTSAIAAANTSKALKPSRLSKTNASHGHDMFVIGTIAIN